MYLSLQDISVNYGKLVAVSNVSFSVERKEIFGLIGPNGCGKSTVLKAIIGLIKPATGKILLEGQQIDPTHTQIRKMLGYCPQENSFYDRLTVKENIKFFADLYGVDGNIGKIAEDLTKSLNLNPKLNELACKLSGGMKRRLNMACSLVHNPPILLLDEPTIELDPFSRMAIWKLVKKIRDSGTTVIISTNAMEEASFLCDRVIFLWAGKAEYTGRPQEIIKTIDRYIWAE